MKTNGKLNKQLEEMMRKANRALAAARFHIKAGDYDFASSRAYYAAFYSMEAVLLKQGLVFSKHSGVMAGFARHFVSIGRYISQGFQQADSALIPRAANRRL